MKELERLESYEFRVEREAAWKELEQLVGAVERRGVRSLSAEQLGRLPRLYRASIAALSVARSISLDRNLVHYLETLSARSYLCVYGTKQKLSEALYRFFVDTYPRGVWRLRRQLGLATLFFLVGVVVAYAMTLNDADRFYSFVDPELAQGRGPDSTREELREVLYGGDETELGGLAYFAAFLFNHNAGIGILSFALGMLAGVPVVIFMFTNGAMLGAFAAVHQRQGLSLDLWSWLLPHGVTEILALLLCGASGLALGQALLFPGRFRRRDRLAMQGKEAGAVVLGTILLFLVAGIIEGVFRQSVQHLGVRYAVAALTAAVWGIYFGFIGRRRDR